MDFPDPKNFPRSEKVDLVNPKDDNISMNELNQMKTDIAVILERTKGLPDMIKQINEIDKKQTSICTKIDNNKDDIKELKAKSNTWNLLNSIGTFLAALLATVFGDWGG